MPRTKWLGEQAVLEEDPSALITRVNLFGWSISGNRSLAEFFFNKLSRGDPCKGFTDVFFCPMLANDLGLLFLRMLDAGLRGLYHTVGSECISKYDFGGRIADAFGFDRDLISPNSVEESGLLAARSPMLTLNTDKLAKAIEKSLPGINSGLLKFKAQYLDGYRAQIMNMSER